MDEPQAQTRSTGGPGIGVWLLFLAMTAGGIALLVWPEDVEEGGEEERPKTAEIHRFAPADTELLVRIKLRKVLRSPVMPMLALNKHTLWRSLRLRSSVKIFLENSGLRLEDGLEIGFAVRGMASTKRPPEAMATFKGAFGAARVKEAFVATFSAQQERIGARSALANDTIGLEIADRLLLGKRPFFDDALASAETLRDHPEVSLVLGALGKEGAITVVGKGSLIPPLRFVGMGSETPQKIRWWALTLDLMGAPKMRGALLVDNTKTAEALYEWIENALGLASIGVSVVEGGLALGSLIEHTTVEPDGRLVRVRMELPLSEVPGLVAAIRANTRW